MIGEIFSGKRKVYNASDGDVHPLPPFEFFIPFAEMKQKPIDRHASDQDDYKPYDAMLDERALRNDLHHFIFICATKEQVLSILDAPWVKVLKNRLYAYHDENGVPIEISHAEVERFKTIVKRFDFQILKGDPSEDVHEGDEVTVIDGPMAGSEGLVKAIRERDGQILLTVELSMFHEQMRLAVPGISIADVRLKTEKTRQLLQDPVIGRFEDELIELLCHLHGKKGSHQLNKEDQLQLRFLYQYSDIVFENNPVDQARFAALMLICAYLMGDKEQIARRSKEVEDLLVHGSLNEMSDVGSLKADVGNSYSSLFTLHSSLNEITVYLTIALFIVTHKPELRKAAKVWVKSHPDCPLVIRRFLSIAKQIRC
jgi:ribosomal protein L24